MKDFLLSAAKIVLIIMIVDVAPFACKKTNNPPVKPLQNSNTAPPITLPDSAMFVGTSDSNKTTIYMLDASTGSFVTKYNYHADALAAWCLALAGNGFLYDVESDKINAINMNTGAIQWTDSVKSYSSSTILHDGTFYGVYSIGAAGSNPTAYVVYALDATKKSSTFLWKYQVSSSYNSFKYYNGIVYVWTGGMYLTALDATTGALKWTISNNNAYSFSSINNGVIIAGNTIIDPASGNQTGTVPPSPLISPVNGSQTSFGEYVSNDLVFVETTQFPAGAPTEVDTSYLSAFDRATGAKKWTVSFGGGNTAYNDTTENIEQVWNNQLIVSTAFTANFGFHGVGTITSFGALDINTGLYKLSYNVEGTYINYFIINNTMYCSGIDDYNRGLSNITNYLYAINLFTGAQKWNNDKLLSGYTGAVSICAFSSGKGYSPNIQ